MADNPQQLLIDETRESAVAISEDFLVLRDVSEKSEMRAADLRLASSILRRWLVENQLKRVASPRVGRLKLSAINNKPIYREARRGTIELFVSGGAIIHGAYVAAGMLTRGPKPVEIQNYRPDVLEVFTLKTFLNQDVIYFKDCWFARQQVIKFVANAAHGVHGHGAREEWEKQLSDFRQEFSVSLADVPDGNKMPYIASQWGIPAGEAIRDQYDPRKVNGVLLEILSTIHFWSIHLMWLP